MDPDRFSPLPDLVAERRDGTYISRPSRHAHNSWTVHRAPSHPRCIVHPLARNHMEGILDDAK